MRGKFAWFPLANRIWRLCTRLEASTYIKPSSYSKTPSPHQLTPTASRPSQNRDDLSHRRCTWCPHRTLLSVRSLPSHIVSAPDDWFLAVPKLRWSITAMLKSIPDSSPPPTTATKRQAVLSSRATRMLLLNCRLPTTAAFGPVPGAMTMDVATRVAAQAASTARPLRPPGQLSLSSTLART